MNKKKSLNAINEVGYHCSPYMFNLDDINFVTLSYFVTVRCHDKDNKSDAQIMCPHDKQDEWVELLDFEYEPDKNEVWDDIGEWDYGDWDSAAVGRGQITLYLYFKQQPCPANGTTFKTIEDDGAIETWTVKDDEVYNSDGKFCNRSEWQECTIFIAKQYPTEKK